jgi:vancomycin permeability regulator SanA
MSRSYREGIAASFQIVKAMALAAEIEALSYRAKALREAAAKLEALYELELRSEAP